MIQKMNTTVKKVSPPSNMTNVFTPRPPPLMLKVTFACLQLAPRFEVS